MLVELEGFAVKPDKIAKAHEWMAFLQQHQAQVDATLPAENMQLEHIFSITIAQRLYLCWYSNQTAPGADVATSDNPIDQQHVAYWTECIDESVRPLKFKLQNTFVPPAMGQNLNFHN